MKNRQRHKTADRDEIKTQGWVHMGVYGCGWMGRSVVVRSNTKMRIGGDQQASHGRKHSCMAGENSPKIHTSYVRHGGTRVVVDGLRLVCMSAMGNINGVGHKNETLED